MPNTTAVSLTVEEIAFAKSAIRVIRALTAVGLTIAIPAVLVLALPVLSYALLAGVLVSPLVIGVVLFRSSRRHVPQAG
jgi:hypothetical protein